VFERLEITVNTPRLKRIIGPGIAFIRVALDAGVRTACVSAFLVLPAIQPKVGEL
jgi:hypothetical protein